MWPDSTMMMRKLQRMALQHLHLAESTSGGGGGSDFTEDR